MTRHGEFINLMHSSKILFEVADSELGTCYDHPLLKHPHPTTLQSSGSVVISSARWLTQRLPELEPPNLTSEEDLYQNCWCDVLSQTILHGRAYRFNDTLYFNVLVHRDYLTKLLNCGFQTTDEAVLFQPHPNNQKNILLLSMSQRTKTLNRHRIDLRSLYLGLYFNNERWRVYNIFEGELPDEEALQNADVLVMPGSSLSIYQNDHRVERLKEKLRPALASNPRLRYVGVCFGAQFLAHLFEGKVTKAKQRIFRNESISIKENDIHEHDFLHPLRNTSSLMIGEYHNDEISQLPENFKLLADSASCPTEIILSNCGRYFGMQCHPDYTQEYMNKFLLSLAGSGSQLQHDYPVRGNDQHVPLRQCISNFIKSDLQN